MKRITLAFIETQIDLLNIKTNNKSEPWTRSDNRSVANVGNYHLSEAYGGCSLVQVTNTGGACSDVFNSGHVSKREISDLISAYVKGIESN